MSETITLLPCQSLALRGAIEAMKADDSIYSACPPIVRDALCDFLMPVYSSAEQEVAALRSHIDENLRLLEKFARRIKELEPLPRAPTARES